MNEAKSVYIFKSRVGLKDEDMDILRERLLEEIRQGVVFLDQRMEFVKHEFVIDGVEVELQFVARESGPEFKDDC